MLDIKFIREHRDLVSLGAKKKHIDFDVDTLIAADDERRALQTEVDDLRNQQNQVSEQIVNAAPETRENLIANMRELKGGLQAKEEALKAVMVKWQNLMVQVPNIPDMSVPEGASDEENQESKTWGEHTQFPFTPQDHVELMKHHDMVDFDRGVKIAGFRGYILKNDGVLLSLAIWNLAQKFFLEKGMQPLIVPSLVNREAFVGTGYLPQSEEDLYKTQDDMYLAGTAEVATMMYHSGEVLAQEELPRRYLSFSPCFRREAGSHGKDTKGLIRVHEFYKWEQVVLCEASHQESVKWHETINRNTEEFIELLGIPYRTVTNCGGDLGLGQVKKYDIELWVPMENKYREISSASYFHDFQTRRLNIKYRDTDGKLRFAHSLNSTAIPTPRILVSLIENYQEADGSIKIPEALVPYMGKGKIEKS
jgi:seryl-tRNA synthetase